MPINFKSLLKPDELAEFEGLSATQQALWSGDFEDAITETLKPLSVVLGVAERILDLAADSDLLPKFAKLQRQYYVALMDQGFTREEALALSTNFSSVLSSLKKG